MPMNPGYGINTVFRYAERLRRCCGTGDEYIRKRISGANPMTIRRSGGVHANSAIERSNHGAVRATVVAFDFGVGAVESADFKDVVAMDLGKVVLDCVKVFMVPVRGDVPNGL